MTDAPTPGVLVSVAEARARILAAFRPLPAETVPLAAALGRVLAGPVAARLTQPPVDVSAMDGYALRHGDLGPAPAFLRRVAEVPAGGFWPGPLHAGDCVRIFTGAAVPAGADTVVIQENTRADEAGGVTVMAVPPKGANIRAAGIDFHAGATPVPPGRRLGARDIGLLAAMNRPWVSVHRRPRVAILATGDEIVLPGDPVGTHQIVSANGPALAALVAGAGGEAINLGIAGDTAASLAEGMADAVEDRDASG